MQNFQILIFDSWFFASWWLFRGETLFLFDWRPQLPWINIRQLRVTTSLLSLWINSCVKPERHSGTLRYFGWLQPLTLIRNDSVRPSSFFNSFWFMPLNIIIILLRQLLFLNRFQMFVSTSEVFGLRLLWLLSLLGLLLSSRPPVYLRRLRKFRLLLLQGWLEFVLFLFS